MSRRTFHHESEDVRRQDLIASTLDCIAEFGLQGLAADVVRLGPAAVGLGADRDEADLGLVLGAGGGGKAQHRGRGGECE